VSTIPVTNFVTSSACVVDTIGKFATGVNDTGGKLPRYQKHQRQIATGWNNIRLQTS
jgi:hypothetical protein